MNNKLVFSARAASDTGRKRKHNEDSWLIHEVDASPPEGKRKGIYMVADGVGGAAAGEIASHMAVQEAVRGYLADRSEDLAAVMRSVILLAHESINRKALEKPQYRGMASTLTALVLLDERALIAQVGDSRAYLIRDDAIQQLTYDQTVTSDLLAKGLITPGEVPNHPRRHMLLQALGGGGAAPEPALSELTILPNDLLLLCTDGLYNLVNDDEIMSIALKTDPQSASANLVNLANARGGTDNITVMIIKVKTKLSRWSISNLLSAMLRKAIATIV